MKRILRAGISMLLAAVVLGPAFAAGGKDQAPADKGVVKLRFMWWGGDARHQATLKVIEQFMAANPGVTIDAEYGGMDGYYQKLTTQISSGTEPDVIQIVPEWFKPLGRGGKTFYDLDADSAALDISGFDQAYLKQSCTIDGHVQGLPTGSNGSILVVNQNFMKRFGIPADQKWDWESIKSLGAQIHQKDPNAYLLGGYGTQITVLSHLVKYYVMQEQGVTGWVNADYSLGFKKEHLVAAFNYFLDLVKVGAMQPPIETSVYKSPLENPSWVSGNVGLMDGMPSTLTTYMTEKVDLDASPVPLAANAPDSGALVGPPQFLVISRKSKNTAMAVKFLNYFYNDPEAIKVLGTVRGPQPTVGATKVLKENNQISALDSKAIEIVYKTASKNFNLLWLASEFETPYSDACNAVILGTRTADQAADRMIKDFTEACDRLKADAK